MRKWAVIAIAICIAALAGASVQFRPDLAIRVATGYAAHNICSKTFVSGLDSQAVFAEVSDRAGIRRLRHLLRFNLDRTASTVDVSTLGLFRSRAAFHDGLGCVDLHGTDAPYLLKTDIEALKASPTRIVAARGATSTGTLPNRTAVALAGRLGTAAVDFPGDHVGFVMFPEQFGRLLHQVLAETPSR